MKTSLLKKFERAHWKLMCLAEANRKSSSEAEQLYQQYNKTWNSWYDRLKSAQNATADRLDKGIELFTVFVPDKCGVREYRRTPNRLISRSLWRRTYPFDFVWYEPGQPHIEILNDKFSRRMYTPEYHFAQHMKVAA